MKKHKNRRPTNWNSFDHALTTLEKQAEKAYGQLKHSLPKQWEKKLDHLKSKDIMRLALKKRNQISKEVKFYADGIVNTLSNAHFLPNKNRLVGVASKTGTKILSMLDFPTKKDVSRLNARLSQLEKRFKSLSSGKRAHARRAHAHHRAAH
ncbi:MAG: hypothetical protein Q7T03_05245 [Deltaproteobacteria bacterium]|nr:hypothetical protein [Deltaproteobacteria bacterium]